MHQPSQIQSLLRPAPTRAIVRRQVKIDCAIEDRGGEPLELLAGVAVRDVIVVEVFVVAVAGDGVGLVEDGFGGGGMVAAVVEGKLENTADPAGELGDVAGWMLHEMGDYLLFFFFGIQQSVN